MSARRLVTLACFIAVLHGVFFIWYQRPDWISQWSDQAGYMRLGEVLASTGKFTPAPDAPRFVPEVIRTPAYPAFLAMVFRLFGMRQVFVAAAQTGLFVLICLMVFDTARHVTSTAIAGTAAVVTALFPPIPYFGALVMTEVWTTFLFTAATWLAIRGLTSGRLGTFAALGLLLALTSLSRPAFALFPIALTALGIVVFPNIPHIRTDGRSRPPVSVRHWMVLLATFFVCMLPWFAYNYVAVGEWTLSPAGGAGRGVWEGSWQATWSGRLQNDLTLLSEAINDRTALDRKIETVAAREHLPEGPMLEYAHQWQDLHQIWAAPTDPYERAMARVAADRAYLRVGAENIRHQTPAHLVKRVARGLFILWAGEIPFRYSDINRLPAAVIRVCWTVQVLLCAAALVGALAVARVHAREACVLSAPIVYVTAVHLPFLTEARQSLPAQPALLVFATIGATIGAKALLALEPQIHEGQRG